MNTRTVNDFLIKLGGTFGIDGLSLNAEGVCTIMLDNSFVVSIEADRNVEVFRFFGNVADIDAVKTPQIYEDLLSANMPSNGKGFSYFFIDRKRQKLCLAAEIDTNKATYEIFLSHLEKFSNFLENAIDTMKNPEPSFGRQESNLALKETAMAQQGVQPSFSQEKLLLQLSNSGL